MANVELQRLSRISESLSVACFTVYFYDYCLTFKHEVELFWMRGWQNVSATGLFFFLSRYLPVAVFALLFPPFDNPWQSTDPHIVTMISAANWLAFFTVISSEGILILRTYALWSCNKYLLGLLSLLLVLLGALFAILYTHADSEAALNKSTIAISAAILGFETVILGATLYRRSSYQSLSTPLLRVLYRDGVFFFACIFVISLINLITAVTKKHLPSQIDLQFLSHSVFSTRIVLHIRAQGHSRPMESESTEMSNLRFNSTLTYHD